MQLWLIWWEAIYLLQPGFSRLRTFMWFAVCVAGLTVRTDKHGVSSIVRALGLDGCFYDNLLDTFHSSAVKLDTLTQLWVKTVLRLFTNPIIFNGRNVLVADGIKVAKQGKKMPGVKSLHQESESNSKAEYIMGHSFQAISLLCRAGKSVFAVPLTARIHEGVVYSNRSKKTLLDKMVDLLMLLELESPYYFVADAYYANQKIIKGMLAADHHLISRVRSNAVAYELYVETNEKKKGRPKTYGHKIKLKDLMEDGTTMTSASSPVYGEKDVCIQYCVRDLIWRSAGVLVRFVIVKHPTRGSCILMSTDTSLSALDIIEIYGLRFKIEHAFKQAVHVIGGFSYHFWMKKMKPLKIGDGNQYMHKKTEEYREAVRRKLHAYHTFVMAGIIAQGLLHYLSSEYAELVWRSFGSWLRTIREGLAPSEFVVATALRHSLPEFLLVSSEEQKLAKFIRERQDPDRFDVFKMAS
jgi:hypothetical protein